MAGGLEARARQLFDIVYPNLLMSIEELGEGTFSHGPRYNRSGKSLELQARYSFADGFLLEIHVTNVHVGARQSVPFIFEDWQRSYYSYAYGPRLGDSLVRIDLDSASGPHVHLPPRIKEHLPMSSVVPDVNDIHPDDFVSHIGQFRRTRVMPIRRR